MTPELVGSIGVGILLLAFVLNLLKRLSEDSIIYLSLNLVGAGLAAIYAFDSGSVPFVVLELAWALTALVRLIIRFVRTIRL